MLQGEAKKAFLQSIGLTGHEAVYYDAETNVLRVGDVEPNFIFQLNGDALDALHHNTSLIGEAIAFNTRDAFAYTSKEIEDKVNKDPWDYSSGYIQRGSFGSDAFKQKMRFARAALRKEQEEAAINAEKASESGLGTLTPGSMD